MQDGIKENKKAWWVDPMKVFIKVSCWIAGPVIAALFIGKFVDKKLDIAPWGFLGTVAVAFIFSCYGIYRESKIYLKELEENDNTRDNNRTTSN